MALVIDQEFGKNWAFYNGDCVFVMSGLPAESIDFTIYSPPFAKLYIYSDSVADMGNTADDYEFFEGFQFALRELYRISKTGAYHAVHCKDLMRYRSTHGYSGIDDFSGNIIQAAEAEGWTYQRRITIWKNPVIEMQRTKTYGLLHKSFATRAEVVRVGLPDYILMFRKEDRPGEYDENWPMPNMPEMVAERIRRIWSGTEETQQYLSDGYLSIRTVKTEVYISNERLSVYTPEHINSISDALGAGLVAFVRCVDIPRFHDNLIVGYYDMGGELIRRFEAQGAWKFHTRISLTDGSYLLGFRNWTDELLENYKELNGQITHDLKAPVDAFKNTVTKKKSSRTVYSGVLLYGSKATSEYETIETDEKPYTQYIDAEGLEHPDYVGNDKPKAWRDDGHYSILVWQRYASPVWFDLDGLPASHKDCWMDINQTDVLNYKAAKDPEDQKHICPLQLDLTERLILEHTQPGDVVVSPYGGISSEAYIAVKLDRKAIISELKSSYWRQGVKYLKEIEQVERQMSFL